MKIDKKEIQAALSTITAPGEGANMIASGAVRNVMTFADEIVVDIVITNPSLQAKKKVENEITTVLREKVYADAKVKVNIKVERPEKPEIKGKSLPNIKNIIL